MLCYSMSYYITLYYVILCYISLYYIIYSKNNSKMVTKNRKELNIDLNDEGSSRRNIQGVTNALFRNISQR